jgi:hypothetical protein
MRLFTNGNRVTQAQYGPGTIVSTDERYTVIEFDEHGQRKFVTTMVTLEATNAPAPAKAETKSRRRKSTAAASAAAKA